MAEYRLYLVNPDDHFQSGFDIECEPDKLDECVGEHADGRAMEVWQGTKVVRKYSVKEAAAFEAQQRTAKATTTAQSAPAE